MVCDKCEKKLAKIITPDPWKAGARNITDNGGRKVGENKALKGSGSKGVSKNRHNPYEDSAKVCRICKQSVHQAGSHYCQHCAYKRGICAMCGKQVMSSEAMKSYRQTTS